MLQFGDKISGRRVLDMRQRLGDEAFDCRDDLVAHAFSVPLPGFSRQSDAPPTWVRLKSI